MKKFAFFTLSVATASFIIIGCGGGGSSSSTSKNTAYYVDEAIAGVEYKCGAYEGITGSQGDFHFEKGKNCSFSLGNIKLREVSKDELKANAQILEDNVSVVALLQSIDVDGNVNNGIEITPEELKILKDSFKNHNNIKDINTTLIVNTLHKHGFKKCKAKKPEEVVNHIRERKNEFIKKLLCGKTFYTWNKEDDGELTLYKVVFANGVMTVYEIEENEDEKESEVNVAIQNGYLVSSGSKKFTVKQKANYIELKRNEKTKKLFYTLSDAKADMNANK